MILSRESRTIGKAREVEMTVACNFCGVGFHRKVRAHRSSDDHRAQLIHAAACCDDCRKAPWRRLVSSPPAFAALAAD